MWIYGCWLYNIEHYLTNSFKFIFIFLPLLFTRSTRTSLKLTKDKNTASKGNIDLKWFWYHFGRRSILRSIFYLRTNKYSALYSLILRVLLRIDPFITAYNAPEYGIYLVRIFSYLDWIREYMGWQSTYSRIQSKCGNMLIR